jgi:hypothetical protein
MNEIHLAVWKNFHNVENHLEKEGMCCLKYFIKAHQSNYSFELVTS